MSGLKINFQKSEVFTIGGDNAIMAFYADMFNCQAGVLPLKYLGVPVTFANLKNVDWDFVDAIFFKWLASWICENASLGGRLRVSYNHVWWGFLLTICPCSSLTKPLLKS